MYVLKNRNLFKLEQASNPQKYGLYRINCCN